MTTLAQELWRDYKTLLEIFKLLKTFGFKASPVKRLQQGALPEHGLDLPVAFNRNRWLY